MYNKYIHIYSRGGVQSALLKHLKYLILFLLEPPGREQFRSLFSVLESRHPLDCKGTYS